MARSVPSPAMGRSYRRQRDRHRLGNEGSAQQQPPSPGRFHRIVHGADHRGTQGPFSMNDQTCAVRFSIKGIDANIVKGTGAYRHATGDFKANVVVSGYTQRLKDGSCDQSNNDPPAFSTTNVVAVGFINLH